MELNREKTKVVNLLKGEAFGFLGFELRRLCKRKKEEYFILMTPKKKARQAVKPRSATSLAESVATPVRACDFPLHRERIFSN